MSGIRTISIGSDRNDLVDLPMTDVRELGIKEILESRVPVKGMLSEIKINGNRYGSNGGHDLGSITLGTEEYISKIHFLVDTNVIDTLAISFWTNTDRCIGSYSPEQEIVGISVNGSIINGTLKDIRLLAIGISYKATFSINLRLKYISDYKPSQRVDTNVGFILNYTPPSLEMAEYVGREEKHLESYTTALDVMLKHNCEASVEAEFIAKLVAKLGAEFSSQAMHTVKTELETKLEHKITKVQKIPEGYVGVKVACGDVFKGANGTHWVFPSSHISHSVVSASEINVFLGYYDLTGVFQSQMPDLTKYKTNKYGYVYYDPKKNYNDDLYVSRRFL